MSWLRFLNNEFRLIKDLIVGDGTPGIKSLFFSNGFIAELQSQHSAPRIWRLPDSGGEIALVSSTSLKAELFSHFIGGNFGEFLNIVAGTGATVLIASTGASTVADPGGRPGIAVLNTGTTAGGRGYLGTHSSTIQFGFGFCKTTATLRIPVLSDNTETFVIRYGFIDSISGDSVDGLYTRYTHSINSGNWQFVSRINNVEQVINLTTAPLTNTWFNLFIDIAPDGTAGSLYINDAFQGTLNNLGGLVTIGRQTGAGLSIVKTLGTTARTIQCDLMYVGFNL